MTTLAQDIDAHGSGALFVLNDIENVAERDFNRWYQLQHVPERLSLPGFRTARRYRAVNGHPAYMALYECDSIEVLAAPVYRERLANPSEWTRKIMPGFRNMVRSACQLRWTAGSGVGGHAVVLRLRPQPGLEPDAASFIHELLGPAIMATWSAVRVAFYEADLAATGGPTPEAALRGGADVSAQWVLILEALDLAAFATHIAGLLAPDALAAAGLVLESRAEYALMHARSGPATPQASEDA